MKWYFRTVWARNTHPSTDDGIRKIPTADDISPFSDIHKWKCGTINWTRHTNNSSLLLSLQTTLEVFNL